MVNAQEKDSVCPHTWLRLVRVGKHKLRVQASYVVVRGVTVYLLGTGKPPNHPLTAREWAAVPLRVVSRGYKTSRQNPEADVHVWAGEWVVGMM